MTPLNNRLKLALITRQKQNNLLQKGFTLVELMIVIVIVGVLSAVALPNFLSQTDKAKATEGKTAISSVLKQAQAAFIENGQAPTTTSACSGSTPTAGTMQDLYGAACDDIQKFNYTATNTGTAPDFIYEVTATGNANDANLTNKTILGCIHMGTGVIKVQSNLDDTTYPDGSTSC